MKIRTPFINAMIRGTEFLVEAGREEGAITVFEGRVEADNPKGKLTLSSGQTAVARRGEPPRGKLVLNPENSVQWALYYPPIISLARLQSSPDPAIRTAISRYLANDVPGALVALEMMPNESAGVEKKALQSALLLTVGRVDEAEPLLAGLLAARPKDDYAIALQAMVDLARNEIEGASRRANLAVRANPESPLAWMAKSYVQQAGFDLEAALADAERAAKLDPKNPLAQPRLAELYASLGRRADGTKTANEALRLAPSSARARSVLGFMQLMAMDATDAEESFRQAIRLDSHDPLARFGLGLARIRQGELEAGTAELEIAASLDPNDSLSRSYLGKAYYEQKRAKPAETQFSLAKRFDPTDPTPWFYEGIKKQTENRPVEALRDVQKAIELNDGRAVYRSRQLLDDDLAARSAALARIYNDLGFAPRAMVEGWQSLAANPANFSAHRLLADAYATLPGQEVARASELLQSQLLQPINSTPIQPHLGEARLLVPQFSGPAQTSFNEFNPIFSRNGFHLQTTGLVGNLDTYGDEAVHSGIWGKFSYSLGQFHYQTNGFRPNNDLKQDIYNAFVQAAVTPEVSVQAEYRHRELEHGDLFFYGDLFNGGSSGFTPNHRSLRTDSIRSGLHYSPNPDSDVIASLGYFDSVSRITALRTASYEIPSQRGFVGETQYIYRRDPLDLILGVGNQALSAGYFNNAYQTAPLRYDIDLTNGYAYAHIRYQERLNWTFGLSVDASRNQWVGGRTQINPKVGMLWQITPDTLLRVAGFRSFSRGTEMPATIEPTQISGFNQFFDGWTGTESWRYGIGLDQRFTKLLVGAEATRQNFTVPASVGYALNQPVYLIHEHETLVRAYTAWAINDSLSATMEYRYQSFSYAGLSLYKNHIIPISINYFHPSGLGTGITYSHISQETYLTATSKRDNFDFGLVDLSLRYRLPQRYGIASLTVKNLFDTKFDFVSQNVFAFRTGRVEEAPWFLPERTLAFQLTLAF